MMKEHADWLLDSGSQQQFDHLVETALQPLDDPLALRKLVAKYCQTPAEAAQLTVEEENEMIVASHGQLGAFFAALHLGELLLTSQPMKYGTAYSSGELGKLMVKRLAGKNCEEVTVAGTNVHNEIIAIKTIFRGGQAECHVYPEEILRWALKAGAHGVIMVHNHPTGDPQPSKCDLQLMSRLQSACLIVGIQLLDCLITGSEDYYSWREAEKSGQMVG